MNIYISRGKLWLVLLAVLAVGLYYLWNDPGVRDFVRRVTEDYSVLFPSF